MTLERGRIGSAFGGIDKFRSTGTIEEVKSFH